MHRLFAALLLFIALLTACQPGSGGLPDPDPFPTLPPVTAIPYIPPQPTLTPTFIPRPTATPNPLFADVPTPAADLPYQIYSDSDNLTSVIIPTDWETVELFEYEVRTLRFRDPVRPDTVIEFNLLTTGDTTADDWLKEQLAQLRALPLRNTVLDNGTRLVEGNGERDGAEVQFQLQVREYGDLVITRAAYAPPAEWEAVSEIVAQAFDSFEVYELHAATALSTDRYLAVPIALEEDLEVTFGMILRRNVYNEIEPAETARLTTAVTNNSPYDTILNTVIITGSIDGESVYSVTVVPPVRQIKAGETLGFTFELSDIADVPVIAELDDANDDFPYLSDPLQTLTFTGEAVVEDIPYTDGYQPHHGLIVESYDTSVGVDIVEVVWVVGYIRNAGNREATFPQVHAAIYNAQGQILGTGMVTLERSMAVGEVASFIIKIVPDTPVQYAAPPATITQVQVFGLNP